jgi:hypothetical protein
MSIAAESKTSNAAKLRASVRKTLREAAQSSDRQDSGRRLLEAYRTLVADTSLVQEDRQQLKQIVRSRLEKLADEIRNLPQQANAQRGPDSAGQGLQDFLAGLVEQSTKPAAAAPPAVLAQRRANNNRPLVGGLPGQNFSPNNRAADTGQELVELIEATISPGSWDTQGGPGTIRYFSPLRVIVVRQTSEVHEQLGDLLPRLRN